MTLQFAEKAAQFVENNERLLDTRTGGYGYKYDNKPYQQKGIFIIILLLLFYILFIYFYLFIFIYLFLFIYFYLFIFIYFFFLFISFSYYLFLFFICSFSLFTVTVNNLLKNHFHSIIIPKLLFRVTSNALPHFNVTKK